MRQHPLVPLALAAACGACAACAGVRGPITTAQLAARPEADALVAYLSQPGADPAACGRVAAALPPEAVPGLPRALLGGLRRGTVRPDAFPGCAASLWPMLPPAAAADLAGGTLDLAVEVLGAGSLDGAEGLQAELGALQRAYLEHPAQVTAPARSRERAAQALARYRKNADPGSPSARGAAELQDVLELEAGRSGGVVVDAAFLAARASAGDEAGLARLARRLPDPALRAEAERALVRLRIARSPFPEVRGDAAAVEARVLQTGVNAIALDAHPVRAGRLDPSRLPSLEVRVRQRLSPGEPAKRGAALLAPAPPGAKPDAAAASGTKPEAWSIVPALPLPGALWLEVGGLSAPVTVCEAGRALDPTPCLAPSDVSAAPGLGWVEGGAVQLLDELTPTQVEALARTRLETALLAGGREVARVGWDVAFERPGDLVLAGAHPGAGGPALQVRAERLATGRLLYRVDGGGAQGLVAVVEAADAAAFHVVSRGARGSAGMDGMRGQDGHDGLSGSSASCFGGGGFRRDGQDGTNGTDGQPGGPGGSGGDGGDVRVVVAAPAALQADTLALVKAAVRSSGGPGGQGGTGGAGGRGGRGGMGGTGASCTHDGQTTWISGGMNGRDGLDGHKGQDGWSGPSGRPGRVTIEVEGAPDA